VPVYGVGAYEQLLGYAGVGHSAGEEAQDLDLAGAQSRGVSRSGGVLLRRFQGILDGPLGRHPPTGRPQRLEGLPAQPGPQSLEGLLVEGAFLRGSVVGGASETPNSRAAASDLSPTSRSKTTPKAVGDA
jgi:hypothetical protein